MTMKSFDTLNISREMKSNLKSLNYMTMTDIQESSIPEIISGEDILAMAKTGSGKTAAFGIGLLENLAVEHFRIQTLILCPTRELAEQVTTEIRRLARFRHNIKIVKLIGGFPMYKQEHSLRHKAHIAVGTPGRVQKLLERGSLNLKHLKTFVLDEADRMLDMGFIDQIDNIFSYTPKDSQVLCFSATFSDSVKKMAADFLNNPKEITVEKKHDNRVIAQHFFDTTDKDKAKVVVELLKEYNPESTIVFCNTKDGCRSVHKELSSLGVKSLALHGDLEQRERTETLIQFSNGSSRILIATDVAARGLDISDLGAVINYDIPFETETYIHRIGRTGRAGKTGLAITLLSERESFRLKSINEYQKTEFNLEDTLEDSDRVINLEPEFVTLSINGGRRTKVSAGDILGALTKGTGLKGDSVGKIDRLDYLTFIAVKKEDADRAYKSLQNSPIKGKNYRVIIHK